jgi:hypothetical protein
MHNFDVDMPMTDHADTASALMRPARPPGRLSTRPGGHAPDNTWTAEFTCRQHHPHTFATVYR